MQGALKRCGRYELIAPIAVGGMAQIYTARVAGAHGFEKVVVIKKILPQMADEPNFRAMFIDEAKIVARLDHPKIVSVLELGLEDGDLFIAMEHVDGLDLLTLLRRSLTAGRRMPPELAAYVALEVLDALDFAHNAEGEDGVGLGIIHRDISPGNILISYRGHVKLIDFGIAQAKESQTKTQTGTLKGKFAYMSPEQVLEQPVDARSDLFAVGTVLAEMLMGHHLFSSGSELDVLLAVRDVKLENLELHGSHIPADLRELLFGALTRRPDDRYDSAATMKDAIADWLHANRRRPQADDLAQFVDSVGAAGDHRAGDNDDGDDDDDDGAVIEIIPSSSALSGPSTRQHELDAEANARLGRNLYARGETARLPSQEEQDDDDDDDDEIMIDEAEPEEATPDRVASFSHIPPIQLLFDIAVGQRQGRLLAQTEERVKEIYFEHGQPVFVRSSIAHERLGQFLVRRGVLKEDELERALGVLPQFGGRLGDTLVGLGLMRPMDALRYLGQQVRDKLVEFCGWADGTGRWYENSRNPWPAVALELDTYDIIGAGVLRIESAAVEAWGLGIIDKYLNAKLPRVDLRVFGLEDRPSKIYNLLDGRKTVGELVQHFPAGEQRLEFLRVLYLLVCIRTAKVI